MGCRGRDGQLVEEYLDGVEMEEVFLVEGRDDGSMNVVIEFSQSRGEFRFV